ncbi:MAG TPA: OsmC family protein [Vicinamibacterales bacterium]|nr:OsmC family protein [Vicinamibacterales bacterium]
MQPFPHTYAVATIATPAGEVVLTSAGLEPLTTAAPAEFDGPGHRWSPETMIAGAVANCFVLTFRAIANASQFHWASLAVDVSGTLERIERVTRFTAFTIRATLEIPAEASEKQARRLLTKAETTCLITRSLNATVHLALDVRAVQAAV